MLTIGSVNMGYVCLGKYKVAFRPAQ